MTAHQSLPREPSECSLYPSNPSSQAYWALQSQPYRSYKLRSSSDCPMTYSKENSCYSSRLHRHLHSSSIRFRVDKARKPASPTSIITVMLVVTQDRISHQGRNIESNQPMGAGNQATPWWRVPRRDTWVAKRRSKSGPSSRMSMLKRLRGPLPRLINRCCLISISIGPRVLLSQAYASRLNWALNSSLTARISRSTVPCNLRTTPYRWTIRSKRSQP